MKFIKKEKKTFFQVKTIKNNCREKIQPCPRRLKIYYYGSQTVFFRRDICPRPECALLDNLPIVSFSLSEKTVSQNRFFFICFRGQLFFCARPSPVPSTEIPGRNLFELFRENMAACVTALKRSHDLENYGFDGLR